MITVTTEELINYKILPFNIYSEFGEKIFSAGENLTPGKLLQLKHLNVLYRDEEETLDIIVDEEDTPITIPEPKEEDKEYTKEDLDKIFDDYSKNSLDKIFDEYSQLATTSKERVVESFNMNPNQVLKSNTVVDEINILNYKGPINKKAKIEPQNQIKLKAFFNETITGISNRPYSETSNLFLNIRDKILQDIIFRNDNIVFSSQIKLIGEYEKCHSLYVAILAGSIAKKMEMNESSISDIVLAGLLHDIGKTRLDPDLLKKQTTLSKQEQKIIQAHTQIGYRMLKEDFKMPENIALVALEHHENNDGSGYPMNKSGDFISKESQIIHICNHFDNLSFNKTSHLVKNSKDAIRALLELGTKYFMPEALYTFIHMFSYNDTMNFEDMIL